MSRFGPATLLTLLVAVVLALGGAYVVRRSLQPQVVVAPPPPPPPPEKKYTVPFAMMDLPAGRKITLSDLMRRELTREQWMKLNLPSDAALQYRYVVGRTLREPVAQGQPFPVSKLYPEGVEPSLGERLKPGMRAVSIHVNNASSAGGFATAGSTIDVMFRPKAGSGGSSDETVTLLDGVEVLSLGSSSYPGQPSNSNNGLVTVAVSTEQAKMLQAVEARGELALALRSSTGGEVGTEKMTLDKLQAMLQPKPPPPPEKKIEPFRAEHYLGTTRKVIEFPVTATGTNP